MKDVQDKKRSKAMRFDELGITVGTVLTYRKSGHTCTVVDAKNKVEYEGKVYTLSGLAKELVGTNASGFATFYLNGVRLSDIPHKTPIAAEIAPVSAYDAAPSQDNTQDAVQAAVAATAQDSVGEADSDAAEKASETVEASSTEAATETEGKSADEEAFDIF